MADHPIPQPRSASKRSGMDWRDLALCQGMDPNTFFPVSSKGAVLTDITEAKRVCGLCPVQGPCLIWAVDQGVDHGIWGGLTETERRELQRRRNRYPKPAP